MPKEPLLEFQLCKPMHLLPATHHHLNAKLTATLFIIILLSMPSSLFLVLLNIFHFLYQSIWSIFTIYITPFHPLPDSFAATYNIYFSYFMSPFIHYLFNSTLHRPLSNVSNHQRLRSALRPLPALSKTRVLAASAF